MSDHGGTTNGVASSDRRLSTLALDGRESPLLAMELEAGLPEDPRDLAHEYPIPFGDSRFQVTEGHQMRRGLRRIVGKAESEIEQRTDRHTHG